MESKPTYRSLVTAPQGKGYDWHNLNTGRLGSLLNQGPAADVYAANGIVWHELSEAFGGLGATQGLADDFARPERRSGSALLVHLADRQGLVTDDEVREQVAHLDATSGLIVERSESASWVVRWVD